MIAPSLYEGFGVALVEAMAARLPIVTTRVGVAADALADGESALIIPTRHAQAIAARWIGCWPTPACASGSARPRATSRCTIASRPP